jgi:hypothetical protein
MITQLSFFFSKDNVSQDKKKAHSRRVPGWDCVDHACRYCSGRLLRRVNANGTVVIRCAECGSNAVGEHASLCWCGVEVRGHGNVFECFRNPEVTDSVPQEVLVRERALVSAPQKKGRTTNPVRIKEFF